MNLKTPGPLSKKGKIILIVLIAALLVLLFLGNRIFQAEESKKKTEEKKAAEVNTESEYTYLDASGNFHTFNLDGDALKNTFPVSNYSIGKTTVKKLYGDVYKKDLAGTVTDANTVDGNGDPLPATKGVENTHIGYLDGRKLSYNDDDYTSLRGIDVSYHQGEIDWEKVKKSGIDFAFLRIGYRGYGKSGKIVEDEQFAANLKGAKKAGVKVGVYFFSQAVTVKEAEEEADFVLKKLGDTKLDLPVVFDPENVGGVDARTDGVSGQQFTKNTLAFCSAVKKDGYEPAVYSNMVWEANRFDMAKIADAEIPVWYADYEPLPQTPYKYFCWQYSSTGSVDGIDGDVDLDILMQRK